MFNKFELIGGGASILAMAAALYLTQVQTNLALNDSMSQLASAPQSGVVTVDQETNTSRVDAITDSVDSSGNLKNMVIEDVKIGEGEAVKDGDSVSVHYIGTLQDGSEFDNSKKRGAPFQFEVGASEVIKGWDEGLVGMKVGGQRILVIPPDKAYGENGIGPIPGGATLVFAIELLSIE